MNAGEAKERKITTCIRLTGDQEYLYFVLRVHQHQPTNSWGLSPMINNNVQRGRIKLKTNSLQQPAQPPLQLLHATATRATLVWVPRILSCVGWCLQFHNFCSRPRAPQNLWNIKFRNLRATLSCGSSYIEYYIYSESNHKAIGPRSQVH